MKRNNRVYSNDIDENETLPTTPPTPPTIPMVDIKLTQDDVKARTIIDLNGKPITVSFTSPISTVMPTLLDIYNPPHNQLSIEEKVEKEEVEIVDDEIITPPMRHMQKKDNIYLRHYNRKLLKYANYLNEYHEIMHGLFLMYMYYGISVVKENQDIREVVVIGDCPQTKYLSNLLYNKFQDKMELVIKPYRKLNISIIDDSNGYIIKNPITSNSSILFPKPSEKELEEISSYTGIKLKYIEDAVSELCTTTKDMDILEMILRENNMEPDNKWTYPPLNKNVKMSVDSLDSIELNTKWNYINLIFHSGKIIKTKKLICIDEFIPDELVGSFTSSIKCYCKVSDDSEKGYSLQEKIQMTPMEIPAWKFLYNDNEQPLPLDDGRIILSGCPDIINIFPLESNMPLLTPMMLPPSIYPLRNFILFLHAFTNSYF